MFGFFEFFLFCCIVGYIYNKRRAFDMIDIIPNRLQAYTYSLFGGESRNDRLRSHNTIRLNSRLQKIESFKEHSKSNARIEKEIFNIKNEEIDIIDPIAVNPLKGMVCQSCSPESSTIQLSPEERRRGVRNILEITQHAGWKPTSTILDWGGWFPFTAQCIRLKKYNFPQVSGTVEVDDRVKRAVEQAAANSLKEKKLMIADTGEFNKHEFDEEEYFQSMVKKHKNRAHNVLYDMRSKISDLLLRITSWVLYKLLPCILSGVVAHPAQMDMLKAVSDKAPGVPLIFLPLHRSHFDYILVSFILLNNDIRCPIVAAGNNLRIPLFGAILRGLGAFFIKRKIDPEDGKKDVVYRSILHTYLQHALESGHNAEFFIEGGRTRTGKPCMPKSGILSVIVDAFNDGKIEDALLVPVSINYERLVDGNFIYEQLGQKKKPESFKSAITAIWNVLRSNYGLMRIDFNEPYSIRELINSFDKNGAHHNSAVVKEIDPMLRQLHHNPSTSSLYGTDIVKESHRQLVDNIARHVIYDCTSTTAVMSTNAVSFLLLTRFRDGVKLAIMCEAFEELKKILIGKKDIAFVGNTEDIILHAVKLLGPEMIVIEQKGNHRFIRPRVEVPNVIELAYYSYGLVPYFAIDSIVATALTMLSKRNATGVIYEKELYEACNIHKDIMRYEFILHKPCQNYEMLLNETLDKFVEQNLIERDFHTIKSYNKCEYEFFGTDADEDNHKKISNQIRLTEIGHCDRLVLMSALAPFGYTYLSAAECLTNLENDSIIEVDFVQHCIQFITQQVENGVYKYGESISTDSIRNSLKLFEKWQAIEINTVCGIRMIKKIEGIDFKNLTDTVKNIIPI